MTEIPTQTWPVSQVMTWCQTTETGIRSFTILGPEVRETSLSPWKANRRVQHQVPSQTAAWSTEPHLLMCGACHTAAILKTFHLLDPSLEEWRQILLRQFAILLKADAARFSVSVRVLKMMLMKLIFAWERAMRCTTFKVYILQNKLNKDRILVW